MRKTHECFRKVNRNLAKHNTRLVTNLLNPNHLVISTEKVEKIRGKKPKTIICAYCPFCGRKLET